MNYQPSMLRDIQLDIAPIADFSDLPPLWALHDLFPCHRLSLVLAPTGSGLTQLACHLASALAKEPGISSLPMICPGRQPDGTLPDPYPNPDFLPPDFDPAAPVPSLPTVLLISHRDAPDVLKPRLTALGIDPYQVLVLSKVHRKLPYVQNQPPETRSAPFSLDDLDALGEVLNEHRTIRLVLIDNADLLFADTNNPARAKIQRRLDALAEIAREAEASIVLLAGVPQLQRNPFSSRLYSAMRDACRLVYFMAPDLTDPEHRLLFCLKNTLSRSSATRQLQPLAPASTASFRALASELQALTYPHYFALLQQQHLRPGPDPVAHDYACEFLQLTLAKGPMPVGSRKNPAPGTLRYLAEEAGLAWGTVLRAKKTLAITSQQHPGHWTWQLPGTIPALPIPHPESPIPNAFPHPTAAERLTANDPKPMTNDQERTCAPDPHTPAQPPLPPQDAPPPPTPAPTCAPGSGGSGASPDTCLERLAQGILCADDPIPAAGAAPSAPDGRGARPTDTCLERLAPGTTTPASSAPASSVDAPSGYGIINNHYPTSSPACAPGSPFVVEASAETTSPQPQPTQPPSPAPSSFPPSSFLPHPSVPSSATIQP